jgi:hypothetical protein
MQAIITSLVFDHSLRMRMKAGTSYGSQDGQVDTPMDDDADAGRQKAVEKEKPKSAALAGMLNDLVTSDLDNLQSGNEFVGTCLFSLCSSSSYRSRMSSGGLSSQTYPRNRISILCSRLEVSYTRTYLRVSLIRRNSAFAGLLIMVTLFPVPAKIAAWMTGYQDRKMTAVSIFGLPRTECRLLDHRRISGSMQLPRVSICPFLSEHGK